MPATSAAQSQIGQLIIKASDLAQQAVALVFVMAVVVFAWGIVKMISAAGNTEKLKQAKSIIWWGIIGMFVLASIGGIIVFLQKDLTIKPNDPMGGISPPQFQPIQPRSTP